MTDGSGVGGGTRGLECVVVEMEGRMGSADQQWKVLTVVVVVTTATQQT